MERTASLAEASQVIAELLYPAILPHPVFIHLIVVVLQELGCLHAWHAPFPNALVNFGAGPSNFTLDMILLELIFTY